MNHAGKVTLFVDHQMVTGGIMPGFGTGRTAGKDFLALPVNLFQLVEDKRH
ncbi:MAG: hypothetical protein NTY53_22085 [Kiritimatiellaeota bacterium]|nr:hypothetical protein [Kiritimatiellota bacterium]